MDRDEADFDPRREDGGGAAENMTRTELVMGTEADHKAGQLGRSEEGSKEKNGSNRAAGFGRDPMPGRPPLLGVAKLIDLRRWRLAAARP